MSNIYDKLEKFLEDRMYEIGRMVYETYNQTIDSLMDTDQIIPAFNNAIEELLSANYEGDAFEIVETLFNKNEEQFLEAHITYLIEVLQSICLEIR